MTEKLRAGENKRKAPDGYGKDPVFALVSEILSTREARSALASLVPEILGLWAKDSSVKKRAAGAVSANIRKSLARKGDEHGQKELAALFTDPERIEGLTQILTKSSDALFEVLENAGKGIEALPMEQQKEAVSKILAAAAGGRSASGLTAWARLLARVQEDSPGFLAEALEPGVKKWIEQADFGEIKDFLDAAADSAGPAAAMINDHLWRYPAKVVLLLSFIPSVVNIALEMAGETINRFNRLSPDLIADVILSCAREIDSHKAGRLVDGLAELARKTATGSVLAGEAGSSGFRRDIRQFLSAFVSSLDPEILYKAKSALSMGRESFEHALYDIAEDNPDFAVQSAGYRHVSWNTSIKTAARKISLLHDHPDDRVQEAFANSLGSLDAGEAAEIANLAAGLVNRIREADPELVPSVAEQFAGSVDPDSLEQAAGGLLRDMEEAFEPIGRVLMPHLAIIACRWLESAKDRDDKLAEEARTAMVSFLEPNRGQQ